MTTPRRLLAEADRGARRTGNTQDAFFPRAVSARLPTIVSGQGDELLERLDDVLAVGVDELLAGETVGM